MIELNEANFKEELAKHPQALVFFHREKGCSFCDKMKPVFEAHNAPYVKAVYLLGQAPDSITSGLVERFPTFAAYAYGEFIAKKEGVLTGEQLDKVFSPESNESKPVPVKQASLSMLIADESVLIDQIYVLKLNLKEVQDEINARRSLVNG